ncbi:MAG TPA: flippase-like domain-containing protein [Thermoanaerobaculia bacterium]|nr:flippase-like domain-containing protein [Thermoanaerobaculia bacterium]
MKFQRISLLVGLGLLFYLLHRVGLAAIGRNLAQIGWGFVYVLVLEAVVLTVNTLAWRATLADPERVPGLALGAMRLAGDGVNALVPAAVVGGELLRARLLSRWVPPAEALASVTLAAMTQFLGQAVFVGLGSLGTEGRGLQPGLRILGAGIGVFLLLFVAMLARLGGGRRERGRIGLDGLDRTVGRLLARFAAEKEFWHDLKLSVRMAIRDRPRALVLSSALFALGWSLSVGEVLIVLKLLGSPVPLRAGLSIAVLAVIVEGTLFFVPGRVGLQEGGLYAIFLVLGLDPARGLSLGIVRRLRELASGGCGLLILSFSGRDLPFGGKPQTNLAGFAP